MTDCQVSLNFGRRGLRAQKKPLSQGRKWSDWTGADGGIIGKREKRAGMNCNYLFTVVNYQNQGVPGGGRGMIGKERLAAMVLKWDVTIPELTGEERRSAYVYLPVSYDWDTERRYPVLYMFDGHNVFFDSDATYGKSWGLGGYLDATETPLIVAAVECNHSPDNGRLSEYSPYTFYDPDLGHFVGQGRTTLDWFVQSFKPEIDRRFRTYPDRRHTFIGGSSMGGLMSLYAALEYNHVFARAASLSPSLWVAPDRLARTIRGADVRRDTVIYMDYGSRELGNHELMEGQFARVVNQLLERRILLTCRIVPGGDHCEASWERQNPFFINTLMYNID